MKNCERCNKEVPEDYVNLLCDDCYKWNEIENTRLKALEPSTSISTQENAKSVPVVKILEGTGVSDIEYKKNKEAEDKEQWSANVALFQRNGVLLWKPTRRMYTFIKDRCIDRITRHPQYPKFIWKPKIVDVGCGSGVGSNVLSQEADMVWGIDKNQTSIRFAKEAFERVKNGIYYSGQLTFDYIDIMKEERELMKFDAVVAIEIIEHIDDYKFFLKQLINKFDNRRPEDSTEYYISTPNRNNDSIKNDHPYNKFHVREWTSEEFYSVLSEFFGDIKFTNSEGEPIEGYTTNHTPLLAICKKTKI
jgi:2-polyprenyl-3-methyl-5-hydroxy-6-metoxy-1,4-benzoquinol methylase